MGARPVRCAEGALTDVRRIADADRDPEQSWRPHCDRRCRFGDLANSPDGWLSRVGARRFAYAKSHYFGNPGSYQVYVLAFNDIGTGDCRPPPPFADPADPRSWSGGRLRPDAGSRPTFEEPLPAWLQSARDRTTVNTLTVLGPDGDVAIISAGQEWTVTQCAC